MYLYLYSNEHACANIKERPSSYYRRNKQGIFENVHSDKNNGKHGKAKHGETDAVKDQSTVPYGAFLYSNWPWRSTSGAILKPSGLNSDQWFVNLSSCIRWSDWMRLEIKLWSSSAMPLSPLFKYLTAPKRTYDGHIDRCSNFNSSPQTWKSPQKSEFTTILNDYVL